MTLERWQARAEWPLLVVSVLFLTAYSMQVLVPHPAVAGPAGILVTASWIVFAIDYVVSIVLAPQRGKWFVRHIHELVIVLLPALRPLRLLRLITLIAVLQRVAGNALRGRVVTYVVAASTLLVYLSGLAIYDAERSHPDASILSFGDAIWWAIVTITTVGYGDLYPVTIAGRFIAVGLMMCGIALLGVVTATLASWLVEKVSAVRSTGETATSEQVESLRSEIRNLQEQLIQVSKPVGDAKELSDSGTAT